VIGDSRAKLQALFFTFYSKQLGLGIIDLTRVVVHLKFDMSCDDIHFSWFFNCIGMKLQFSGMYELEILLVQL
jgi:hypothetical protein